MERLTIDQAARESGRSPRDLRLLIESGGLAASRNAGRWLIERADLERLTRGAAARAPGSSGPSAPGGPHGPLESLAAEVTALRSGRVEPLGDELSGLRARLDLAEARIARLERAAPGPHPRRPTMRDALHPLFGRSTPAEGGEPERS